jgi:signal transduction histidine kinase
MKRLSFRSIIVITLIGVIGLMSSSAFYIYSIYLKELIHIEAERKAEYEKSILAALDMLKDQFYYSIDAHDGRVIKTILLRMNERDEVLDAYLYDGYGDIKFSLKNDTIQHLKISSEELLSSEEEIYLKSFPLEEPPFTRAYFRMPNIPSCYECHASEQQNLGYVVIDVALPIADENISFIRKSSILFTLIMIFVIIAFIMLMHYRFVRKSLGDFKSTIHSINNGNLDIRLSIPETKELGILGKNFNSMMDNFQQAQKELKEFHRKELRSNYKLATIGEMSARLAHEIRNPITGIANAIEIIVSETSDQENKPIFEEIQRQTNRVNNAVSDLLKYARKKDLNLEINNINEIIRPLVFFLGNQVNEKEININLELQENVPLLRVDHMQIEDVLLNLGLNAIQAITGKGTVTYKTTFSEAENRIFIFVTDTGKGIPQENLSNIFHPFFTTRNEGTGLGLAIVKDITNKHKGEIWVENNTTAGCTFTISLPVERE